MSGAAMGLREIHALTRTLESIGAQTREWIITVPGCPPLLEHGFGLVGWSRARDGFFFVRPDPAFGQILACFGGHGEVLIEGIWQTCGPGQAYVTPPHVRHAYRALPGESWRIAWVHDYSGAVRATKPRTVSANASAFQNVLAGLHAELMGASVEPPGEHGSPRVPLSSDREAIEAWLYLLETHTRRIARTDEANRLWPLWDAVTADLAHPWSVPELARRAGVSEEHLRRLSLDETGSSPMRHVTRLRMRHAETLLASGRYTVGEVAVRVGYENPFAFATAFKRTVGKPPSRVCSG